MSAAKKLKVYKESKQKKVVFRDTHPLFLLALYDAGEQGLTDFELAGMLNKDKNNTTWRRVELTYLGYVEDSGKTRAAPSGRKVSVWHITKLGAKKAQQLLSEGAKP